MSLSALYLRLVSALLAGAAATAGPAARAEPPANDAVMVALGQWQVKNGHLLLLVALADALTEKQKSIISGGFTTVSQLDLSLPKPGQDEDDDDPTQRFYSVRCSVKFDAWAETYDVARLDDSPKTALVKQFSEYGEMCLKAEVNRTDILQRLARTGGTLFAHLIVKQTSIEEATRIKEWLIQQQSGVMQSLFSHMLGELTLNQSLSLRISVPPKAEAAGDPYGGKPVPPPPLPASTGGAGKVGTDKKG